MWFQLSNFFLSDLSVEKWKTRNLWHRKTQQENAEPKIHFCWRKIFQNQSPRNEENPPIDNFVYSSKLREYIAKELRQRNQNDIAESYSGYSKNQITDLKEEQLKRNNKFDSKVSQSVNTHS